jgi:hypothetical protein
MRSFVSDHFRKRTWVAVPDRTGPRRRTCGPRRLRRVLDDLAARLGCDAGPLSGRAPRPARGQVGGRLRTVISPRDEPCSGWWFPYAGHCGCLMGRTPRGDRQSVTLFF